MPCSLSCGVSAVFLIGMIYMNYATYDSNIIVNYKKQLPENLVGTYEKIVDVRTRIYYFVYILGFILSLIIIFYNTQIRKNRFSTLTLV